MSNSELCKAFIEGATKGKGNSMHIDGDEIFSYNTAIGRREADGAFSLDIIKYSQTTARHQFHLRSAAFNAKVKVTYKYGI